MINVITGRGSEVGAALVGHPGVKKISFTGGVETARAIVRQSAPTISSG